MKVRKSTKNNLLPYPVVALAANGDADAIDVVLKHYENYITVLAVKRLHDKHGNSYLCVDGALKSRLEAKLIAKILTFKVA